MQCLGRAAAAVIQLQRSLTAESLHRACWVPGAPATYAPAFSSVLQECGLTTRACCQVGSDSTRTSSAGTSTVTSSTTSTSSSTWQHKLQPTYAWSSTPGSCWSVRRGYAAAAAPQGGRVNPLSALVPDAIPSPVTQQQQPVEAVKLPGPIEGVCHRRNVKCGWKKIDFVLRMIRRSTVDDAMMQLGANPKRAAMFVKHALANARGNAVYAGADPSKLWVVEAFVTKGRYDKQRHIMGRGYSSIRKTRHSHLNVKVHQMDDAFIAAASLKRTPRLIAPIMARMQQRQQQRMHALRRNLWWGHGAGASSGGAGGSSVRVAAQR